VLITDRTDLDDQLSGQFTNAKHYIGDQTVISVESRAQLRELLKGRNSGGVFLTTIHKFTEDTELLTERCNVICISDDAHREWRKAHLRHCQIPARFPVNTSLVCPHFTNEYCPVFNDFSVS
jgi:hypothetical protein